MCGIMYMNACKQRMELSELEEDMPVQAGVVKDDMLEKEELEKLEKEKPLEYLVPQMAPTWTGELEKEKPLEDLVPTWTGE